MKYQQKERHYNKHSNSISEIDMHNTKNKQRQQVYTSRRKKSANLEDKMTELTKSEGKKKKKKKKVKHLVNWWDIIKQTSIIIMGITEEKKKNEAKDCRVAWEHVDYHV